MLSQFPFDTLRVAVLKWFRRHTWPRCRPINSLIPDRRMDRQSVKASHLLRGIKRQQQVTFQPWTITRGDVEKTGGEKGEGLRSWQLSENNRVGGK